MSYFEHRLGDENIWVIMRDMPDGSRQVSVLDAMRKEVTDERDRTRALVAALREESRRRTALWEALPEAAKRAIREERENGQAR